MSACPGPPGGRLLLRRRRPPPPPPPTPPSRLARPSLPSPPRLVLALFLGLALSVAAAGAAASVEVAAAPGSLEAVSVEAAVAADLSEIPMHDITPNSLEDRRRPSIVPSTAPPPRIIIPPRNSTTTTVHTTTSTTTTSSTTLPPPPPPVRIPIPAEKTTSSPKTTPAPTILDALNVTLPAPATVSVLYPDKPLFNLTVGYLPACKGELPDRQCVSISGAITLALEEVNNNSKVLPWVRLLLKWNDTRSSTVTATRAITEMVCEGVAAFFGPEGFCHVESIVSHSWNIPMFSFHCSDEKESFVTTLARTEPPNKQVTKSILALLKYYDWKKFAVLWEPAWESVAKSLMRQATFANASITYKQLLLDKNACCANDMKCCYKNVWYQTISITRDITRIYVFLGQPTTLVEMMKQMNDMKLFDQGEYLVISADMMPYTHVDTQKFIWDPGEQSNISCSKSAEIRGRSLLIVGSTPPRNSNYSRFAEKVNDYSSKSPFNFTTPDILRKSHYKKKITIYAAYLYDAVILYAKSLHHVLLNHIRSKGEGVTQEDIERLAKIAKNGTDIINALKEEKTYDSITGATINIDDNADSEGNFSVITMVPEAIQDPASNNYNCGFHLRPIGTFSISGKGLEYNVNGTPWWIGGKPLDEPSCGFQNEYCRDENRSPSVIAAGTLGILLFCAAVITLSIYRKWKIEQEIEGLLWKIDRSDLRGYFGNDIVSSPSKMSLASAASCESRCGQQLFAPTATYRSVTVRLKELKFSRRKDISREIMKEMRLLRDLRHDNINSFIGACIEPMRILLITDYCTKGSLYDIVENEDLKLDKMFISSLVHDLIKGMIYIHKSALGCHGNLKSSNCVVTSRWVLQVTDFGLHELRHSADNSGSIGEHQHYRSLFWKAPELLRDSTGSLLLGREKADVQAVQKADVYAFAIILYEIFGKKGPYGGCPWEPKEIIEMVKEAPRPDEKPFRPDLTLLDLEETPCEDFVIDCIEDCWSEAPENRPDFSSIRTRLRPLKEGSGRHRNIMDQMMEIMEKYAENLEALVNERTRQLAEEKRKTVDLLNRMLPAPVADQLTKGFGVEPESFETVTIYFSDIVGFTAMSAESTPLQVVNFLNDLYTLFDRIIKGYDVYKVETIGDAYMVVSGLPLRNEDRHAGEIASMSLDLLDAVKNHRIAHRPNDILKLRIGIHTGPVVAGVVGLTMPRYCLFGDTVNTASRMESTGEPLKIHISPQCRDALDKLGGYLVEERGMVALKGKGEVCTYWLTGATDCAVQRREVALDEMPPPLFCRPRRSPRLCAESRQASSLCAVPSSRRHSSAPRAGSGGAYGYFIGAPGSDSPAPSRSQRSGSSPEHALLRGCRMVDTSPLYLGSRHDCGSVGDSRATLTADGDLSPHASRDLGLDSDLDEQEEDMCNSPHMMAPPFDKRLLAAMGRSPLRETRSLDPFPAPPSRRPPRRDSRSLENCVAPSPEDEHVHGSGSLLRLRGREGGSSRMLRGSRGVVPNGDTRLSGDGDGGDGGGSGGICMGGGGGGGGSAEDVQAPLLLAMGMGAGAGAVAGAGVAGGKRWHSLEDVAPGDTAHALPSNGFGKKALARGSIRSWLVGLFQGNGLRPDPATALRNGLGGYSDLQSESIV